MIEFKVWLIYVRYVILVILKEDILIRNVNVLENIDINELLCLYGIKFLMKVIYRDSYVNKVELVKFI